MPKNVLAESPADIKEGLLEIVVTLSADIIILKIFHAVEGDRLGRDFSVCDVNFVTTKHCRDTVCVSNFRRCGSYWGCIGIVLAALCRLWRRSPDLFLRVATDAADVAVPIGNILVCYSTRYIKHKYCSLSTNAGRKNA
jgi:hypothetical protein